MTQTDINQTDEPQVQWEHRITQALFVAMLIVSFVIFWYAGRLLHIPAEFAAGGSLLRQPSVTTTIVALVSAVVLLVGCVLLATPLLRRRWFMAPLAAALGGWSAWSMRGGPMHEVLLYAPSTGVFVQLALELLLLGAIVGGLWLTVWHLAGDAALLEEEREPLSAIFMQFFVMAVIVLIVAQTDAKKQCVAAIFWGAVTSTALARGAGRWYSVAPILLGVVGYLLAAEQSSGWTSGSRELDGFLAPLARPLPLDYASVGTFGALVGFWTSRPMPGEESDDR